MMVLAYGIPIVLFICGIKKPKSKAISFLFMAYFFILMGLNTNTPDYESYRISYEYYGALNYSLELGFGLIITLCKAIGLTYQQFRMVFAILYSLFSIIAVCRLTKYRNYVLALFLFMPFVLNVSGIRFALASIIVCCGIPCLMPQCKRGIVKYVLLVLVGMTVHRAVVVYLIFCLARKKYKLQQYLFVMAVVFGGMIIMRTNILINLVQLVVPDASLYTKWLDAGSGDIGRLNLVGFVSNVFFVVVFPLWISYLARILCGGAQDSIVEDLYSIEDEKIQRIQLYKNISINGLMMIPGYLISSEYQRYLFGVLIVYYAVFAEFKYEVKRMQRGNKMLHDMISILLPFLLLGLYMYSMTSHNVMATFIDNMLFK